MGRYERKNKGNTHRNPRSRSTMFPSLQGDMNWWKYRSRSPLSFPSKICKNHRRNGGGRANFEGQQWRIEKPNSCPAQGGRKGIYTPSSKYVTVGVTNTG
jgi:hypothetical protein